MFSTELSFDEYRKIDALNPSLLVHAIHSWKQFRHVQENGFKPKCDTSVGTALHLFAESLPNGSMEDHYTVMPDFRGDPRNMTGSGSKSTARTTWVQQQEHLYTLENSGKEIIGQREFDRVSRMLSSLDGCREAVDLITGGAREVSMQANLGRVNCKGRADGITGTTLWDIKTTNDIREHQFGRTASNLHYVFKMSFYWRLLYALDTPIDRVVLIAVQDSIPRKDGGYNEAPDCCVYDIPMVAIENQMGKIDSLLAGYRECFNLGKWPGVPGGILAIPNWAMEESTLVD